MKLPIFIEKYYWLPIVFSIAFIFASAMIPKKRKLYKLKAVSVISKDTLVFDKVNERKNYFFILKGSSKLYKKNLVWSQVKPSSNLNN